MTRTLKAKRGGMSRRRYRLYIRARRAGARGPWFVWDITEAEWTSGPCDPRHGRTFRGWRHARAVGP